MCLCGLHVLFSLTLPGMPLGVFMSLSIGSSHPRSDVLLDLRDDLTLLVVCRELHVHVTPTCFFLLVFSGRL